MGSRSLRVCLSTGTSVAREDAGLGLLPGKTYKTTADTYRI